MNQAEKMNNEDLQEMEAMWAESTKQSIPLDCQLIETVQNDEHGEGVEELVETFTSYWNTFNPLRKLEEKGKVLTQLEKEVYVLIVDEILLPILKKMDQWGYQDWVRENEFSYEV